MSTPNETQGRGRHVLRLKRYRPRHVIRLKRYTPGRDEVTATPGDSALLRLPPELRNIIYELVLTDTTGQPVDLRHLSQPPISRVCRQTRSETMGLIVPALNNRKWSVPLLVCYQCNGRYGYPGNAGWDGFELCPHLGGNLVDWTMAPWLKTLTKESTMPLQTRELVTFYRESKAGCYSRIRLDSTVRHIDDSRTRTINRVTMKRVGDRMLDLRQVVSLARSFYKPHFFTRLNSTYHIVPRKKLCDLHAECDTLGRWTQFTEPGQESEMERALAEEESIMRPW